MKKTNVEKQSWGGKGRKVMLVKMEWSGCTFEQKSERNEEE